jgi:uncharacterized protein (TIGR03546 family)
MRLILKLIKAMNSETDPAQISLGLCLGLVAGLTPLFSLHNILILLLVLVLRVNVSAFIASTLLCSGIAWAIDPLFSRIGLAVLELEALVGLWTALYNITLFRLEHFNNSIVMGSLITSLILIVPLFFAFTKLINLYRDKVLTWVNKLKLVQTIKAGRLYKIYDSLTGWDV